MGVHIHMKDGARVSVFSEREENVIDIIGRKKMTLQLICEELFMHDYNKPFDAEISVGGTVRRIIKKCDHHELNWTFAKKKIGKKMFIYKVSR